MIYKFCHIPKTGGVSICEALGKKVIGHQVMKKEDGIFLYSVVRNPLDRTVSSFFYLKNGGRNQYDKADAGKYDIVNLTFEQFVLQKLESASKKQVHFLPQNYWIPDGVDFLMKFEDLQEDFSWLCGIIGIPLKKLKITNISKHKDYMYYYKNRDVLDKVKEVYKTDFEKFYD